MNGVLRLLVPTCGRALTSWTIAYPSGRVPMASPTSVRSETESSSTHSSPPRKTYLRGRFDEPALRTRSKMRVLVRALFGTMPELGLHCLHRFAARHSLARDRMPTHFVMAEHSETELLLYELQRPYVAVDAARKNAVRRKEKLAAGVALAHVPIDGGKNIGRQIEHVCLFVLA